MHGPMTNGGPVERYVFGDEAGNFDFSRNRGASRYFAIATATVEDASALGAGMLDLRRSLAADGIALESCFHATEDSQVVRDAVFKYISGAPIRIDATLFEKSKAQPQTRTDEYFYKLAWFGHFKHVAPRALKGTSRALITAAAIGTKKRRKAVRLALHDVAAQCMPWQTDWSVAFWSADSDPCLQVADYCTWAIQRKLELGDTRSYDLIADKIASEYDFFRFGKTHYY